MNRRDFVKYTAAGTAVLTTYGAAIFESGCNATNVAKVIGILNLIVPSVTGVLAVVATFTGTPIAGALVVAIGTAVTTALDLISKWEAAPPPDKPGIMGEIIKAVKLIQANLSEILGSIPVAIPEALRSKIAAVLNFIISEVFTLISVFSAMASGQMKLAREKASAIPAANPKDFKTLYNQMMSLTTGYTEADTEAKAHLLK